MVLNLGDGAWHGVRTKTWQDVRLWRRERKWRGKLKIELFSIRIKKEMNMSQVWNMRWEALRRQYLASKGHKAKTVETYELIGSEVLMTFVNDFINTFNCRWLAKLWLYGSFWNSVWNVAPLLYSIQTYIPFDEDVTIDHALFSKVMGNNHEGTQ